jgi:thiol-disulfide isomerase/thioredoxin
MYKPAVLFAVAIAALVVLAGGLTYYYLGGNQEPYSNGSGQNGDDPNEGLQLAPEFNLPRVGGGSVRLSDLQGRVVVLDFMATWCAPCEMEFDHLKEIRAAYPSSEVAIYSIDVDARETESMLVTYSSEMGLTWDILRDTEGISSAPGYEASNIPTLVVVNKDGYIAGREIGVTDADDLMAMIDQLT